MSRRIVHRDREAHGKGAGRGALRGHTWLKVIASFGIAGLAMVPATVANASGTPATNVLHTGSALEPGKSLLSQNGDYRLIMQRDGNLVLYKQNSPTWSSRTEGHPGALADLQRDGNFVIYLGHKPLWETATYNGGGATNDLVVQDDGNVVIYNGQNKPLWWTNHPLDSQLLQLGDSGASVLTLQRRLNQLHYWLGPQNGSFGDSTQQAVWALQKAAGLPRDGIVGPSTWAALNRGVMPVPRPAAGNLIEVNLSDDLVMILRQGKLWATLNTSTGGGYTYTSDGVTSVAITPQGVFHIFAAIDGIDVDSLGTLWRPRFFYEGFAIHGDSYVPPYPVSHGCVRVSNEAIDWIWAQNVAPIGTEFWVF
ncbi:MAG: peptidoglycan-binding protein [Acidimicrobiales bacterium]|jgi:N-acetylmuramoyl-L-alanine amidase